MNTQLLGDRTPRKRIPYGTDIHNKKYAELDKQRRLEEASNRKNIKDNKNEQTEETSQTPLIDSNAEYWIIPQVNYRNELVEVHLAKQLFGENKTQDEWAEYSQQARKSGDFYVPDYPLFYNLVEGLFNLKDKQGKQTTEEIREQLQSLLRAEWLTTLTRIQYAPKGKDKIIHNYGLDDRIDITQKVVGEEGQIPAGSSESLYQDLLGTKSSVQEISNVFQWLNQTPTTYIWRLNHKPKQLTERVAMFYADSDGADLDCDRNPDGRDDSLGVRLVVGTSLN